MPTVTITRAGGYDPALDRAHPANQDPTLPPAPTLDTLPAAYERARAEALRNALHPSGPPAPNICLYCGKRRTPLPGSTLDGHAICVVTADFIAAVDALYRSDPKLNRPAIAAALGVSHMTVKAWTPNQAVRR